MVGMADLLLEAPLEGEQRARLELMQKASKNLLDLFDDVLDLNKIEDGRIPLSERLFNPGRLVDDTCAILGQQAREKGLVLKHRIGRVCRSASWATPQVCAASCAT